MIATTATPGTRRTRGPFDTDERLLQQHRVGPVDRLPAGGILALLPQLPDWPAATVHRTRRLRGAGTILDWLNAHPGEGWQDRWTVSGADRDTGWIEMLAPGDTRRAITKRQEHIAGLGCLLMCRVVLPSYDFLAAYRATGLLDRVREIMRPEIFARLENAAAERGLSGRDRGDALSVISKIVLHTGTDIDALTAGDVLEMFAWSIHADPPRRQVPGLHAAWDLLGDIGVTPAGTTLRSAQRRGQRTTAELVDDYGISCRPVRDVLVRYLDERRPALDYKTLAGLAGELAGTFWADIERHHPGIGTLHLPEEIAQAWKERVRVITAADGTVRPRKNIHALLMRVRAFYLDIQQWALEDPSWVPWAVPSPVRRNDTQGYEKARRKTVAAMHQRVRERLPHLPALADAAGRCLAETTALLAAAAGCEPDEVFDHAGSRYRRTAPKSAGLAARHQGNPSVTAENLVTGETVNLTRREDEAFWAWAIIETLRLSGVRLEELLEITHLALVSYKLPGSGEIVPLLQIVPSKSNEERLLLVDPELASVLATIITRLRAGNDGTVPLVARYDHHERTTGPLLPHLFQRALGARREVISPGTVYKLINTALAAAGLQRRHGPAPGLPAPRFPEVLHHGSRHRRAARAHRSPDSRSQEPDHHGNVHGRLPGRPDPFLPGFPRQAAGHPARRRIPRAHRPRMARIPEALPAAQGGAGNLRAPLRGVLPARARLPAMRDASRFAAAASPPHRDHPQPPRTHRRSTDERLARRSPRTPGQPGSR